MIEGFCYRHQADVEISPLRRCLEDDSLALPPSWGSQTWIWADGAWVNGKPRPEGYVWQLPAYAQAAPPAPKKSPRQKTAVSSSLDKKLRPPAPKPGRKFTTTTRRVNVQTERGAGLVTFSCVTCRATVTISRHGGPPQKYCGRRCADRAVRARTRAAAGRLTETTACPPCAAWIPVWPSQGGPRRTYCSPACRIRHLRESKQQPLDPRHCLGCDATFVPDRPFVQERQKWCSKRRRETTRRRVKREQERQGVAA